MFLSFEAAFPHVKACLLRMKLIQEHKTLLRKAIYKSELLKKIILLILYHTKFIQITPIWSGKITAREQVTL